MTFRSWTKNNKYQALAQNCRHLTSKIGSIFFKWFWAKANI